MAHPCTRQFFLIRPKKFNFFLRSRHEEACHYITALHNRLYPVAQNQPYQFSRMDIGQGLSNNQINTILRDSKGFMWFGTMSGLNRFDGYTFTVFRHNLPRLLHHWPMTSSSACTKGPDNTIWVENRQWSQYLRSPYWKSLSRNGYCLYWAGMRCRLPR